MSIRKIIVYQKNSTKPIVLTDESNQKIDELKNQITNLFSQDNIYTFATSNDLLIGRPSDLQSVLISGIEEDQKEEKKSEPEKYQKDLELNV